MIRKGLRPGFKIGFDQPVERGGFRKVLPFRRSWLAIAILAIFDIVFLIPAVLTFQEAAGAWSGFNNLFDLVAALFLTAWLMGWSIAPLSMTAILLVMLFGREVVTAHRGRVDLFIGLPFLGLTAKYEASRMRNLRLEHPPKKSGTSWRGPHMAFDYGANKVGFGSDIGSVDADEIRSRIETASGTRIRSGEALPEEVKGKWKPVKEPVASATVDEMPGSAERAPLSLASPSTLALILANLVPIAGTVFLDWKLSDVMVLYWAESAVIGFFNICKIAVIGRWMALAAGPFFLGHFGGFMSIHFLFIYTLFVKGIQNDMGNGGDLAEVAQLFFNLWPALAVLFISHAFSFFTNFLGRKEYRERTIGDQMSEPYSRIVFMHLVLIFGGGLSLILGEPAPVLVLVIAAKIFFDVRAHLKEHARP